MYLDVQGCPRNKSLAEHISDKVSTYVRVAEFIQTKKDMVFRMLVDPDLSEKEVADLLCLQVAKNGKLYKMNMLECLMGPVVDHDEAPSVSQQTMYLRITYTL